MPTASVSDQIRTNPDVIPTLPDVVAKAMQLVDEPEVKPADFEALLQRDPGLVAAMLRLANSPIYGFAHPRETIRDAIIGMGLSGLRGVLLGSTLKRFFGKQFDSYGKDPKTLWRHAMAVATVAKLLTKRLPNSPDDPEEMFVAGLLHDLGKLLLAPFLTRMNEDMTKCTGPLHFVEEKLLGIDHQEAGGIVAEKWNLKPLVRAVISQHHFKHCPRSCEHAVAVVRLADQCATNHGISAGSLGPDSEFLANDLARVGLEPEQWHELSEEFAEQIHAALGEG